MKKILIIHNRYQYVGGEDIATDKEIQLLSKNYDVETLIYENSKKDLIYTFISFFTNTNYKSLKILKKKLKEFNPDIVYIHNTWFKASVGLVNYLVKSDIEVFLKIHNFRYFCTKSYKAKSHFGEGEVCGACGLSKNDMGIFNKYFPDASIFKSLFIARYGKKYYQLLKNKNIKLIVLTDFHKNFLIEHGFNKNNISVQRNNIQTDLPRPLKHKEKTIVYAGRISEEKGVKNIINAFLDSELSEFILKIVGDGPMKKVLENKFASQRVIFTGELPNNETIKLINSASAVITGTKLYEGQPTLLCEASYLRVPSIFPNLGGIHEFFPPSYSFSYQSNDKDDLVDKINKLSNSNLTEGLKQKNFEHIVNLLDVNSLENNFEKILNDR
jgi:glycosyltransferase involved in cell wall biosynthesis